MLLIIALGYNVMVKRNLVLLLAVAAIIVAIGFRVALFNTASAPITTGSGQRTNSTLSFDKSKYSLTDANSIWVVVNKKRQLPDGFKPADLTVPKVKLASSSINDEMHLTKETAKAVEKLFTGAANEKLNLLLVSGFRSQAFQSVLYNSFVKSLGSDQANRSSAKPGYSEHQTGLAADIGSTSRKCEIDQCFGQLAEGKWLAANAHKYGFIIRYPDNKEKVTGYMYEPWHFRYVGVDLATEMKTKNIATLEEFFEL